MMQKHFDCFYVPTIKVIKHVSLDMCWLINQLIEPQVQKPEKNRFIVYVNYRVVYAFLSMITLSKGAGIFLHVC